MNDLALIQSPDNWPRWPILPVKSHKLSTDSAPLCGIMIAEGKPKVYEKNIWDLVKAPLFPQVKDSPLHEYATFEALAADWEVDA